MHAASTRINRTRSSGRLVETTCLPHHEERCLSVQHGNRIRCGQVPVQASTDSTGDMRSAAAGS